MKWLFFGENYSTQGRKPDPKKIKAIVKMKQPENKKEMQTFLGMVWYLQKVPITPVSPSRTTEGPHQNKFTLHFGSRIHHCNECNPRRDGMSTHPKVLWSKEENCSTNRCQLQRTWSMSSARWTPNLLCQQIPYRCRKRVCSNWAQSSCCIMGLWEISSLSLWFTLYPTDRPKTPGTNPCMISHWGNSQIAETFDKSKCMWF